MDYEKISFIEAIEKIANKYGISLSYQKNKTSLDLFTKLYEIHISAEQLFINNINDSKPIVPEAQTCPIIGGKAPAAPPITIF